MIVFKHKGDFQKTESFLTGAKRLKCLRILKKYAQKGVEALVLATPIDTGLTSQSWGYKVDVSRNGYIINWTNSNIVDGVPIAIILQYGHGTRSGTYVKGRNYINPAIQPLFEMLAKEIWREVERL